MYYVSSLVPPEGLVCVCCCFVPFVFLAFFPVYTTCILLGVFWPPFANISFLITHQKKKKNCEVCELAKHQCYVFRAHPCKKSAPFTLIHIDIWGPSHVPNLSNTRWFISFIDDHSRLCWIYLMKEKSETFSIFKQFHLMVQTQFNSKIKIVHTNNGIKYFSNILGSYFKHNGIIHHSSCVNTP